MTTHLPALVADIGGTHSRFGLVENGDQPLRISSERVLRNADHPDLEGAVRAYLAAVAPARPARAAALAVACPVTGDEVQLTNLDWRFSIERTREVLGLASLTVLNDFSALALALPRLGPEHRQVWHERPAAPGAPIGVVGPGTGLGVGGMVWSRGGWVPLATEGGHVDLAATNEREWRIVQALAERHGHVSAERVLSGPGLAALYENLAALDGHPASVAPEDVAPRAAAGDRVAVATLEQFAAWLGALAGDLALTLGAKGGIYVAGGIVPKLGDAFPRRVFLERFFAKGRFAGYLDAIPVQLVVHPTAALLGAAVALIEGAR